MAQRILLRRGQYADSVALMLLSRTVAELPGVQAALVAMATELNLQLLAGMGFDQPPAESANDLLIAIRATDDAALEQALGQAERMLAAPAGAGSAPAGELPPRTVGAAASRFGSGLAVISVPGQHAFVEAMDALEAGCDVLLFSDNVPLEQEIALKDAAAERGLLVMGPDCGTAVIGGVGLGFAHTLAARPGRGAGRLGHRCPAGAVPAGCGRCRHHRRARRRRPGPVRAGGRPLDPGRVGAAGRRSGHRADPAGVQAAGRADRGGVAGRGRSAGHADPVRAARPGRTGPHRGGRAGAAGARRRGAVLAVLDRLSRPGRRPAACAGCSAAARCATRRCCWPAPRSARSGPTSRSGRTGRCPTRWRSPPGTGWSTSATMR